MAAYTGITLDLAKLGTLSNSSLPDAGYADYSIVAVKGEAITALGTKANITTTQPVDNKTGILLGDFANLWYNRVHILPNNIDVGNLTSQQVRPIEIFNAYFEPRTLSAVAATDLSGVSFDVSTPQTLAALESTFKNLNINTVGTPEFDGYFTLTFDDAKQFYFLYVSGKRVLVMPFQHNWSTKISERLSWYNTSSGKSLDGIEQIIMLRDKPRRLLNYDFLLASTNTNAARLRALFTALMSGWQNRIFAVPIWSDATRLTVQADAGSNEVMINTAYLDYDASSYVMLWQNEENYELVEIDTVLADRLQLNVNLVNTWQAGKTIILPARLGYINQNLQGTKHTVDIDTVPVSFELLPQYYSLNRLLYAAQVLYRTYPVLLIKNDYNPTSSFAIEQQVIRNDANTGIFTLTPDQPAPDVSNSFAFLFANHVQIAAYYGWLDQRKGRIGVFWQPTWSKDMQVVQDIASNANNILIKFIDYSSLYYIDGSPAYNRRDVMIVLKNGTKFFRRITGAAVNNDNTETISIDSILGQTVLVSDIDRVCFLIPSALKADAVEINWISGNVSQSEIQIADVYDDQI